MKLKYSEAPAPPQVSHPVKTNNRSKGESEVTSSYPQWSSTLDNMTENACLPAAQTKTNNSAATTITAPMVADGLAQSLAAAMQAGLTDKAAELAVELSKLRVKCDIKVSEEENELRRKEAEFSVKVHVEDRVSDSCFINLSVKASDTIGDLKRKLMVLHNFPMEVQRWIIGKKIYPDHTRLQQCGVKRAGHTLYLYLVTAHSVGLNKLNYEAQRQAILLSQQAGGVSSLPRGAPPPQQQLSHSGSVTLSTSSLETSLRDSGLVGHDPLCSGDSMDQTKLVPLTIRQQQGAHHQMSASSISPGSMRLQEMLQSPHLSAFSVATSPGTPGTPAENVLTHVSPGLSADAWEANANTTIAAAVPTTMTTVTIMSRNNNSSSSSSGNSSSGNNFIHQELQQPVFPPSSAPTGPPGEYDEEEQTEGWECPACTYRNLPMWPGCEMCHRQRPEDYQVPPDYVMTEREMRLLQDEQMLERLTREEEENMNDGARLENYQHLLAIEDLDLVPNPEPFQCAICFDDIGVGDGIMLRECLHQFCRDCLRGAVQHCENATLTCPYQDSEYSCDAALQEREIRALVPEDMFFKYLQRGLDQAEVQMQNSYHCKTANCPGWCVYEDQINFFTCPVCFQTNCLTCKAIHMGQNCQQYQDELRIMASNDASAKQTHEMLKNLVSNGEAMHCPQCQVIVQKKGGCDWIRCSICKTEICWVTKGPRWGPKGEGDMSGGCRCRLNGKKCHPQCVNCH